MDNVHIERIIEHISKTLPIISDSVNEIANYINKNEKVDVKVIDSLKNILNNLRLKDLDGEVIMLSGNIQAIELYQKYIDGVTNILKGVDKFVVILLAQKNMPETKGMVPFTGSQDEAQKLIKSGVDDLYEGSKEIIAVIDIAVSDD